MRKRVWTWALVGGMAAGVAGCEHRTPSPTSVQQGMEQVLAFAVEQQGAGNGSAIYAGGVGGVLRVSENPGCFSHAPAVSPDGRMVVYVSCSSPYGEDLYLGQPGLSGARLLTRTPDVESNPAWSPDGRWIAFDDDRGDVHGIVIIDSTGGHFRLIAQPLRSFRLGGWSFDAGSIVCSVEGADASVSQIMIVYVPSLTMLEVTSGPGRKSHPVWSRDRTLAYVRDGALCLLHGTSDSLITTVPGAVTGHVTWSPDAQWLVFEGTDSAGRTDIYRVRRDGADLVRLTAASFPGSTPVLSPDGTRIAYVARIGTTGKIYVMRADGSAMFPVTSFATNESEPAWTTAQRQ